ncbi:P2Y purinoceptor 3 [Chanos chanos]|uniref:P2Y purinoceptor 3 n=1 Tax=Chanos chanos TaxID=29144 RepID=A0A6J2WX14_CHACN|nr:P2Y purinoceptor 3-like [Chanos chanos]
MKTTVASGAIMSEMLTRVNKTISLNSTISPLPPNCSKDESYKYIILPLCYSLTFILSLALNSTVLLRSHRQRNNHRWNASVIYMVNLASTDLMYSFSLPFLVISYLMRDHWVFGDFMCRLVRFLFYFNLYCSIFFLTCISVHRYMGICHPIRSITLESKRTVKGICAVVWSVVFALTCPIFRFAQTGQVIRRTEEEGQEFGDAEQGSGDKEIEAERFWNCWDDAIDREFSEYVPYGIVLHLLGFFVPFVIIAWCYSRVVRTIFQTLHSQPQLQECVVVSGGAEGGRERTSVSFSGSQHSPYVSRRRRSIKTIVTITLLFALCFLPFHVTRTLFLVLKEIKEVECHTMRTVSICYKVTRPLASCNSWLNALLYFLTGDKNMPCCVKTDKAPDRLLWPLKTLHKAKEREVPEPEEPEKTQHEETDSKSSGIS